MVRFQFSYSDKADLTLALSTPCSPAVIVSYLVAGVAALLSALCYAEMAVSLPIAGGAFNYICITFGELAAW